MSNVTPLRTASSPAANRPTTQGSAALAHAPRQGAYAAATSAPASGATPAGGDLHAVAPVEARGFVLYVGLDEAKAAADGTSLSSLVAALRRVLAEEAPSATSHASVALAPKGAGGRDVDVVRLALGDPQATAARRGPEEPERAAGRPGVTVDTTRQRVLIDGENAQVTFTEFEVLQALILREGRAVDRNELIDVVWDHSPEERPSDRTIDVHIRRLRSKLGEYGDIVRTVRGAGYRFDRHADVHVQSAPTRSPDRF